MAGNLGTDTDGQNQFFQFVTVAVVLLVCAVAYGILKELRQTGGSVTQYVRPVQPAVAKTATPRPAARPQPGPVRALPETQPRQEAAAPRVASQPPPARTLPAPAVPAPVQGLAPKAEIQMLPAPLTEVHPLSDAEEVMGAPSSEVGEIGVTRTFKLPDDEGQTEAYPLPNE